MKKSQIYWKDKNGQEVVSAAESCWEKSICLLEKPEVSLDSWVYFNHSKLYWLFPNMSLFLGPFLKYMFCYVGKILQISFL